MREKNEVHQFFEVDSETGHAHCIYCKSIRKDKDIRRYINHLAVCDKVPSEEGRRWQLLANTNKQKRQRTQSGDSHTSSNLSTAQSSDIPPDTLNHAPISRWLDTVSNADNLELKNDLARIFYCTGIPFNLVNNKMIIDFFKKIRPGFVLPSRYTLAGNMLDIHYKEMVGKVMNVIQNEKYLTMVSDAWTNCRNESIVNYVLNTSSGKSLFWASNHTGIESHTGAFIASEMNKMITSIGVGKIIAICCDNAANQRLAMKLLRNLHPKIFTIGCISHSLNLVIGDIVSLPAYSSILQKCLDIVKCFVIIIFHMVY